MQTKLPDVISTYIEASNSRDAERFVALFRKDAVVHDEGQEHQGVAALKNWLVATARKYAFTLTPVALSENEDEVVLTAKMTGDFPGSPISAEFHFVLDHGEIAKLDIRA